MLEFARQQWLWLFALVALFYVAWWFARRYRRQRVTYGRIWERVAKRVVPPGWKRILRTVLTLLISGAMLASVVLFAAGLQRPVQEQPAPAMVVIVLENSPAMRAGNRAQLAAARAQAIVDSLGEDDRALVAWFQLGRPMLGPWLKRGDVVGPPLPTDFAPADADALWREIAALRPPPGMPDAPAPRRLAFWLGNTAPAAAPAMVETFGRAEFNNGIVSAVYTPPLPADAHHGLLEVELLGSLALLFDAAGRPVGLLDGPVELPEGEVFELRTVPGDSLPQDDSARLNIRLRGLRRVVVCYPAEDGEANPYLLRMLEEFLPGREVMTHAVPGDAVQADLLVADRALPDEYEASWLLCFGVVPAAVGEIGPAVRAEPNLQLAVPEPLGLGFEVPDLSLLSARAAVPLKPGHGLTPLARHTEGGVLVAATRDLLYCGFLPHQSTLLQDSSGLLLLLRWVHSLQVRESAALPPFVQADAVTPVALDQPGELRLELSPSAPWLPAFGPRAYTLVTGPDGRGEIGPLVIPGEYVVTLDGREVGRVTALRAVSELPYSEAPATDLSAHFARSFEADWRDYLPGALLWLAFALLVIEWPLWLLGLTE